MKTIDIYGPKIDFFEAALNEERHIPMPAHPPAQHVVHFVKQSCLEHDQIIWPAPQLRCVHKFAFLSQFAKSPNASTASPSSRPACQFSSCHKQAHPDPEYPAN